MMVTSSEDATDYNDNGLDIRRNYKESHHYPLTAWGGGGGLSRRSVFPE